MTPKEARELWATTLETTDRPQTRSKLADGKGRCCLGIACDLAVEHGVIDSYNPDEPLAPAVVAEWLGLVTQWRSDAPYKLYQHHYSHMNDNGQASFKEIAKKVRELND